MALLVQYSSSQLAFLTSWFSRVGINEMWNMTYLALGSQLFYFGETESGRKILLEHLLLQLFPCQRGSLILNSTVDILSIVLIPETCSLPFWTTLLQGSRESSNSCKVQKKTREVKRGSHGIIAWGMQSFSSVHTIKPEGLKNSSD